MPLPRAARIVLAVPPGDDALGQRIARHQAAVARRDQPASHLERLGHLFIARARTTFDSGFYTLAEECAVAIEALAPGSRSALLLRGHVLHATHQFAAAEGIARQLVARDGGFLEQGLLGDVLLDRGDLQAAMACYQAMLDQRPCLQSYTRAATVLRMRGQDAAALELMTLATGAGSPRDPEPLAWTWVQVAELRALLGHENAVVDRALERAQALVPGYAPALRLSGVLAHLRGELGAAVASLAEAAAQRPEPEVLWTYAELLRASGDAEGAAATEATLRDTGAAEDPRTMAVYLTAQGEPARALPLLRRELEQRQDPITYGALAFTQLLLGAQSEAVAAADRATSTGVVDARLDYHAGAVLLASGQRERGAELLRRARDRGDHRLLPSERRDLQRRLRSL